ncbi:inositol monophosphatase family protein [Bdellovibrio sp. HCB337]|uniref:inositol monophosphatase family protein n=1 Tax=Bdellovibrio sp. HCB337 TaxID=3394358 RepID=UPI0039A74B43
METSGENSGNSIDLGQALHVGLKACRLGREVLLKYIGNLQHISEKFQAGLVSEADKESEKVISDYLRKNFPSIEFLGEESSYEGAKVQLASAGAQGRWILDPLDGTTNYIHQFPIFCISLALEVNGEIQVAVIDCPKMGETYTAVRGQGAFMNGMRLKIGSAEHLKDALLATGFVAEKHSVIEEQLKIFADVVYKCRGVRRPGAAAYDLALVARGVFDGFWERNLQPWDSAAGLLLVEEAGGKVVTYRGKKYNPYKNSIIAGNALVVDELTKILQPYLNGETD